MERAGEREHSAWGPRTKAGKESSDDTPWAFNRCEDEPAPLIGGPNGSYAHEVRDATKIALLSRCFKITGASD